MSYEPTIIALKKDLDKHHDWILYGDWQYEGTKEYKKDQKTKLGEGGNTVMEYLKSVYNNHTGISIGGIKLILMTPEFTQFNGLVRDKLIKLKVEYALD